MKLNGASQTMMNGACPALLGAIAPLADNKKTAAMCSLAHLIIWVGPEQCAKE